MGNNQGAIHKRERTQEGQQRTRLWSGSASTPLGSGGSVAEDGCPVQVSLIICYFEQAVIGSKMAFLLF